MTDDEILALLPPIASVSAQTDASLQRLVTVPASGLLASVASGPALAARTPVINACVDQTGRGTGRQHGGGGEV
jgi:hypothetical protein